MTSLAPPPPADDAPRTPAAARAPGRAGPAAGRPGREQCRQGDVFDRLLLRKTEDSEPGPGEQAEAGPFAGLPALAGWLPGAPAAALATTANAAPAASPTHGGNPPARAAFEAAANPQPTFSLLAPAGAHEATAWQVTLNDPAGLAVELRVSRPEGSAAEPAPWTLTLTADTSGAALLAPHAQRLGERLRTRAVALAHLRIESDDEPPQSD